MSFFCDQFVVSFNYIERILNSLTDNLQEELQTDKPYLDKLESILHFIVEVTESGSGLDDAKIRSNPVLSRLVDSVAEKQFELFLELIAEGKRQGYLNPDLSDEAVRTYFGIIIQGMKADSQIHDKILHNPRLFHDLLLLILHGFGKTR